MLFYYFFESGAKLMSNKKFVLFFVVVGLLNMASGFAHPVTPTLFKSLNLEAYMFGVALACMLVSNFFFSPFWGKISGYISSRNTLLICCAGYALGQLFFALSQTKWQFLLARFFAGIFTGGYSVGILTYTVNTAFDEKMRGRHLVIATTLQSVCNALGFFVGGMLGEIHVYVAIIAQVITLALCGVLFRVFCVDDTTVSLKSLQTKDLVREANPFNAFVLGRHFITTALALLFTICALQSLGQIAFDQTFNYYVIDQLGFSSGYNGAIKFVTAIVTLIANGTVCVWLMNKTDTRKSIIFVLLSCAVSIAVALFINVLVPFLIVNILFYAFSSISMPILQDLAASSATKESNLVMGIYNALKSFGGIIGAFIAGFTYVISPQMPFICCVIAFGIAVVFALLYKNHVNKKADA